MPEVRNKTYTQTATQARSAPTICAHARTQDTRHIRRDVFYAAASPASQRGSAPTILAPLATRTGMLRHAPTLRRFSMHCAPMSGACEHIACCAIPGWNEGARKSIL